MTPRVTTGELHRGDCATVGDRDMQFVCDCDGATILADMRERLAAAIEAQSCGSDCYEHAARIVRERP